MRRDIRKNNKDEMSMRIIKYSAIAVAILTVIVFGALIYSKKINDEIKEGTITGEQLSSILNNTVSSNQTENTESASSEIGKSINEVANDIKEKNTTNTITNNKTDKDNKTNNVLTTNKINSNNTTSQTNSKVEENTGNKNVELNFEKPVEGEIVRDFAVDNLIYSNTLQEWVTHNGIDIKADKTTVVKASEEGTVKSIKNDPRYGITVVIEHSNGYSSVYSNLLTAEFVKEKEKVKKGQTIGTVGNTATFEIADEAHLHFEILKNNEYVDPSQYIK